jgi:hypothetical protein
MSLNNKIPLLCKFSVSLSPVNLQLPFVESNSLIVLQCLAYDIAWLSKLILLLHGQKQLSFMLRVCTPHNMVCGVSVGLSFQPTGFQCEDRSAFSVFPNRLGHHLQVKLEDDASHAVLLSPTQGT